MMYIFSASRYKVEYFISRVVLKIEGAIEKDGHRAVTGEVSRRLCNQGIFQSSRNEIFASVGLCSLRTSHGWICFQSKSLTSQLNSFFLCADLRICPS